MKANVWHGKNDVRIEQVPDPRILNPRDAIVRITSTAICGSDLHLYDGYMPSMEAGDILGHEFMGEVVDVGAAVHNALAAWWRLPLPQRRPSGMLSTVNDQLRRSTDIRSTGPVGNVVGPPTWPNSAA